MAQLTQVLAAFHTNDYDKAADSVLSISLNRSGLAIAGIQGITGHFDDYTDDGPFPLSIFTPIDESEILGCTTTVRIDPNGKNTWCFNYSLQLTFSDGVITVRNFEGNTLDQDSRVGTFAL